MAVKIVSAKTSARVVDESPAPSMGLGDAVELVAKPVARALGVKNCGPCRRRKARLNAAGARAGARIRRIFHPKAEPPPS